MLGVCYYPEHWPAEQWSDDARRMRGLGLSTVRIGEFAWSRLEPAQGEYDFAWFDQAIDTLAGEGLKLVIGTPTATPPKWLVDRFPDVLPVDPATGATRGFGSRRHYDFSSETYMRESLRIVEALARRYGRHPGVIGWQTDNELCCHDTALSASTTARDAFRAWCASRYQLIGALNRAWGNVFWSMEYASFDEIELPFGAVTETSPAHRFAFRRFTSDQVAHYHARQVDVIRRHAPTHFVTHNFIPYQATGVDNYAITAPLDFASYDSYPLGITDMMLADRPAGEARRYMRTGHPDITAFNLDQTRGLSRDPFWIMEQQPGPVNWAPNNPRPVPGMVRFWTLQAFAHGAACVSYFRWRQAPFAQEQMHAGLLRPDSRPAEAWPEIEQVVGELASLGIDDEPVAAAQTAIIVDIKAQWVSDIERQGEAYDYKAVLFDYYAALRRIGVDVDFVAPGADLSGYRLVLAPALAIADPVSVDALRRTDAIVVIGPRSGAKTDDFTIPANLPPGGLQALLPLHVESVETLRGDCPEPLNWNGGVYESRIWRETIAVPDDAAIVASYADGAPAVVRCGRHIYLATLTDGRFLSGFFATLCAEAAIATLPLAEDVRTRRRGRLTFAFNYADAPRAASAPNHARFILGSDMIPPRDVAVWEDRV